jgi:hypothetical protein
MEFVSPDLLYVIVGPVLNLLGVGAVLLLGFALLKEITR